jgi:hypothetical protein
VQPILPCLLRHLLAQGSLDKAVRLARGSLGRPHLVHSLEWLLFTALEAHAAAARCKRGKRSSAGTALPAHPHTPRHRFPKHLHHLISDAPKDWERYTSFVNPRGPASYTEDRAFTRLLLRRYPSDAAHTSNTGFGRNPTGERKTPVWGKKENRG